MSEFRPCCLIPTYDNRHTLESVVRSVRQHLSDIVVVDDGSAPAARQVAERLERQGMAHVFFREHNGGKGAAVKTGFAAAAKLGYTHALQVDADGQHNLNDIPKFLEQARREPQSLVLGAPAFGPEAPRSRLIGRRITQFWTFIEVAGATIQDPMCGFRVYPLTAARRAPVVGNRMDFDIEIAVRMVWDNVEVINLPTLVRYIDAAQGGVSHFHMVRDNVMISLTHTRLVMLSPFALLARWWRRRLLRRAARRQRLPAPTPREPCP